MESGSNTQRGAGTAGGVRFVMTKELHQNQSPLSKEGINHQQGSAQMGTELVPRFVQHPQKGATSPSPIASSPFIQQGKKERNKTRSRVTHTKSQPQKETVFIFISQHQH